VIERKQRMTLAPSSSWYVTITVVCCVALSGAVAGQDLSTSPLPQLPAALSWWADGSLLHAKRLRRRRVHLKTENNASPGYRGEVL
jgi:hypothetical protein